MFFGCRPSSAPHQPFPHLGRIDRWRPLPIFLSSRRGHGRRRPGAGAGAAPPAAEARPPAAGRVAPGRWRPRPPPRPPPPPAARPLTPPAPPAGPSHPWRVCGAPNPPKRQGASIPDRGEFTFLAHAHSFLPMRRPAPLVLKLVGENGFPNTDPRAGDKSSSPMTIGKDFAVTSLHLCSRFAFLTDWESRPPPPQATGCTPRSLARRISSTRRSGRPGWWPGPPAARFPGLDEGP